jgi:DNA-binding CsgD family transcriptional regulator
VITDLVEPKVAARSAAINECLPRYEAERMVVARMSSTPFGQLGAAAFMLGRSRRQPAWTPAEIELLSRALPVFEGAYHRLESAAAEPVLAGLSHVLDRADCGAISIFDEESLLIWSSHKAQAMWSRHFSRERNPATALEGAVRRMNASLKRKRSPRTMKIRLSATGAGGPCLVAHLWIAYFWAQGRHVVVVRFESPPLDAEERESVAEDYGLSRAEKAVATELMQGLTNPEIGARLFISPETVRTHLRHIFEKLGARSRVEVVLKLRAPNTPDG